MENFLVFDLWTVLSPTERRLFLKFLESPAHNLRRDVKALARFLAESGEPNPDKRAVFAAVFPGQPYDNLRFNYTCSFLVQRLEVFLVFRELDTETGRIWRGLFLSRALRRRGAAGHFTRKASKLAQTMDSQPLRNAEHHLIRYLLENERYQHRVLYERESPTGLSDVTDPLNHFFMLENLRWAGTALSLEARYGISNPRPFMEVVLEEARGADPQGHPEIAMMRLGYLTLNDIENEENFRNMKVLLVEKSHLFSAAEKRDLYQLAINFCLRRHNRGERPGYTREALELYRNALQKGLLLEQQYLQKFTFNNIVRLACIAGERDWARRFLDEYQHFLPADDRANAYRFNLACWHYLGREYARVPALLQTFDFSDRDTQLSTRQMLLRSYYELQEWQALDSLLKSFYTFLRRRHDIGYQRQMYRNLIKFTKKLIAGPLSRRKAEQLAERIRQEPYVAEREWLLEKTAGKIYR